MALLIALFFLFSAFTLDFLGITRGLSLLPFIISSIFFICLSFFLSSVLSCYFWTSTLIFFCFRTTSSRLLTLLLLAILASFLDSSFLSLYFFDFLSLLRKSPGLSFISFTISVVVLPILTPLVLLLRLLLYLAIASLLESYYCFPLIILVSLCFCHTTSSSSTNGPRSVCSTGQF